jgi:hypothetical protein
MVDGVSSAAQEIMQSKGQEAAYTPSQTMVSKHCSFHRTTAWLLCLLPVVHVHACLRLPLINSARQHKQNSNVSNDTCEFLMNFERALVIAVRARAGKNLL